MGEAGRRGREEGIGEGRDRGEVGEGGRWVRWGRRVRWGEEGRREGG